MKQIPPGPIDQRARFLLNTRQSEKISNPIWAVQTYLTASPTTTLDFFATRPATLGDGNIKSAGTLPARHYQEVIGILVKAEAQLAAGAPGATNAINDIRLLGRTGIAVLSVSNKQYGVWPLWMLFAGSGIFMTSGLTGTNATPVGLTYGNTGLPDPRAYYEMPTALIIPEQQPFSFQMRWAANVAVSADVRLTVVLEGSEYRPVT